MMTPILTLEDAISVAGMSFMVGSMLGCLLAVWVRG